jgi:glycosyltransferase involved in cell wall biosynthesis
MGKIKILEMIDRSFLGGGQINLLSIAEALDKSRFDVAVCSQGNGPLVEELRHRDIRHFPVSLQKIPSRKVLKLLKNLMVSEGFEIVHTHGGVAGLYGRWAAFRSGVPIVIHTLHGIHYLHYRNIFIRWAYIFLERILSRFTKAVIFVSQADRKKGCQYKLAPVEKMKVVKNGIDFSKVKREAVITQRAGLKENLGSEDSFLIGTVARIHRQKNIPCLIKAAAVLSNRIPRAKIIIVGDGPMMTEVKNLIERFGLQKMVLMLGERSDVYQIMSLFDIFVLTSLWEGLPYVLMEAGVLGKPVVASDIEGVREIILDGESGLLVPRDDPQTLVEVLMRLEADPQLRFKLGRSLQKKIKDEYSLSRMIKEIENIYLESAVTVKELLDQ